MDDDSNKTINHGSGSGGTGDTQDEHTAPQPDQQHEQQRERVAPLRWWERARTRKPRADRRKPADQKKPPQDETDGAGGSWLKRLTDNAGYVRSLMTTAVVAVALIAVVTLAVWDSLRDAVVLDSIEVPAALADRGYTSAVATRELADAIRDIQHESEKVELQRRGEEVDLGLTLADIQIPGGAISISALVRYVRQALRMPERRVSGEITFDTDALQLGTTRLRLVVRGTGALSFTWTGESEKIDNLMRSGAIEIIKNIDPYVAAVYYSASDPKLSADIIQRYCLTRQPAEDDPWAMALLGNILHDQGRIDLALGQFESAAAKAVDPGNIADIHVSWAATLRDIGHYNEALGHLDTAANNNPDDVALHAVWTTILGDLGKPRAERGRRDMVVENSNNAIAAHPGSAIAHLALAWAVHGMADADPRLREQAKRSVEQAMEIYPAATHYYRGIFFEQDREFNQAIDEFKAVVNAQPRSAKSYFILGLAFLDLGASEARAKSVGVPARNARYDDAIVNFNKALELDPSFAAALIELGYIHETLGQHDEATAQYQRALKIFDEDRDDRGKALAYFAWGQAFADIGLFRRAVEKFALAAGFDPSNALAYDWWGWALTRIDPGNKEKIELAAQKFRRVVELEPDFALAYLQLGDQLVALDRLYEAAAQYGRAIEIDPRADGYVDWADAIAALAGESQSAADYERAGAELAEAVKRHQRDAEALRKFANVYATWGSQLEQDGRYGDAIDKYRQAAALDPDGSYAYEAWGRALGAWSKVERERDSSLDAAEQLDALAATDGMKPRLAKVYHSWGSYLVEQHDHERAIAKYRIAIEYDPTYIAAYGAWGTALAGLAASRGRYEAAMAQLEGAIRSAKGDTTAFARVFNGIGAAFALQEQFADAVKAYERATLLDRNYVEPHLGWAHVLYSQALKAEGQDQRKKLYDEATKMIDHAIDMYPIDPSPYVIWGRMLGDLKRYDEAIEKFERAIDIKPDYKFAYEGLARVLYNKPDYTAAIEKFGSAIDIDPKYALAYEGRGRAYAQLGKPRDAITQYKKALELEPVQFENLAKEIKQLEAKAPANNPPLAR